MTQLIYGTNIKEMRKSKIKLQDLKISKSLTNNYIKAMTDGKSNQSYGYWRDLKDSLEKEGYQPKKHKKGYIRCLSNGDMIDGNHRAVVLYHLYGPLKEINVEIISKIYYIWCTILAIFTLSGNNWYINKIFKRLG